ncbi:MAG: magnesium-translocating P-type ATPase [Patescibacteria group bacterium]|nr:magnesium-translocating P-type ATPase [Patescibacteria group bacterium]
MKNVVSKEKQYGLTKAQLDILLPKKGQNIVNNEKTKNNFTLFLAEFKSPLVVILIVASILSFSTGSFIEGLIIITIVILSSIINFVSYYRSNKAVAMLLKKVRLIVSVYRDNVIVRIPAEELIPGDVVVLEAGNIVPADGLIRESKDFFVNESSLTGESLPIEKNHGDEIFLGTGVVTGTALLDVVRIGVATKYYSIVAGLSKAQPKSEFEIGIRKFSVLVTKVAIGMALVVFIINAIFKGDILSAILFATAISVGITPELLPMIIALNTSRASVRMSKKGIIVKKLGAVQNFGSMDILCTDKTGTLTEDKITVIKYLSSNGQDSEYVLELAYITSMFHTGHRGSLDQAISETKKFDITSYQKIDEIPFDFERRRDGMVIIKDNVRTLISKGAPENVLTVCNMSDVDRSKAQKLFESLSMEGYRVLAVATRVLIEKKEVYEPKEENSMHFEGFIAFIDPPKKDVKKVLDELIRRGIHIKIITGDHLLVAEKIAKEVGFESIVTLDGPDIEKMSDDELSVKLEATNIFSRVVPDQKNRIIYLLKTQGHVVGYMGDGINDAQALKTADIGISVSNAVDVAKESADIVLSHKSFRELIDGVLEGRKTFTNTTKYISMAVSSNFGNMFSMTGASLIFRFLPMLPAQILLNNLLYEVSQLSIPFDTVEEDILNKPRPWNINFIKHFMIVFGLASSVFDFLTFFILFKIFHLSDGSFQTGWFIQSFATQTLVIFIIRSPKVFWNTIPSSLIVRVTIWASIFVAWSIALSVVGHIFGFVSLPLYIVIAIAGIVILYLLTIEIIKHSFYKRFAI